MILNDKLLYRIWQNFRGGKLSWLQDETPFAGKFSWSGV